MGKSDFSVHEQCVLSPWKISPCTTFSMLSLSLQQMIKSNFRKRITMTPFLVLLLLASSLNHGYAQFHPKNEAFISLSITQNGLDFMKELLVNKAISSLIPLQLPNIEKTSKIPVVGNVYMVLSNITIYHIYVPSSSVKPGETGISITASGVTCDLSMNWYYSYSTWLVPVEISDRGRAEVQVKSMEVGLTLGLENQEGSLKLKLKDCGSNVKDISIKLDGGASWLYQGVVDAFEEKIGSAVENAITKKLTKGISRLDSYLESLPKEVPVDDHTSLNAKFMHWIVDQIPDQSLLNTAGWRFIIPQLYKKYPNHDMNFNISLSSPPVVEISNQKAGAITIVDMTIDVLEEDKVIPVACISLVIQATGALKISGNNLVGDIRLNDFQMSLKWSKIGNLRMYLIQPVVWTLIETVFLPHANTRLNKGLPLPIIHGFILQNAEIILSTSRLAVCSDVAFTESNKRFSYFIQ
ncbi:putative BPI/LBP family protein At1g04970 isoform X2 [Vigna angularis]|uniref:putative BPI/LBP family protein At1g04970 isoform X2 n=1 Tax=Phaseolus angularis TaxID=3914 RepID=UPI0022B5775E|nr:putative BPI/LBP family protein At1g04970 isoform X2 [Vigna angularis]